MAAPLTALGRQASDPIVQRCLCGCGAFATRGFPNDAWYAARCVPPALRFPWEPGYAAPAPDPAPLPSPPPDGGAAAASQPELF